MLKTHCKRGHEWTPENTGRQADGSRQCRACRREDTRARRNGTLVGQQKTRLVERLALILREVASGRVCASCGVCKPLVEYHRDPTGRLGRAYSCKECVRPAKRAHQAGYRDQNREAVRESVRRGRLRDVEGWNRQRRERYARDPEAFLRHVRRRRVRRLNVPGSHTPQEWEALKARFGYRCVACGATGVVLHEDHIIPLTWAGSTDNIENIQPLCVSCNTAKGDRHATDYRPKEVAA